MTRASGNNSAPVPCPDSGRTDEIVINVKKLQEDVKELEKWRAFTEGALAAFGWVRTVGLVFLGAGCTLIIQLLMRAMK